MGTRLPSAGEVLIIPPTGKKGSLPHRSTGVNPFHPGATCQEVGAFQSRIRTQCGPVGMQSEVEEYDPK
jgi:hypothetical protein